MPFAPPHACNRPGCPALVPRGDRYCKPHQRQREATRNAERMAQPRERDLLRFYSSVAWKRLRASYRSEHPLCEECERRGVVRAMTEVDHRIPIRNGGARLDKANLQSLCTQHHAAKSGREGNMRRVAR